MSIIRPVALWSVLAVGGLTATSAFAETKMAKKCDAHGKICTSGKDCNAANCPKKHEGVKPK